MWYYILNDDGQIISATQTEPLEGVNFTIEIPPIGLKKPAFNGTIWYESYVVNIEDEYKMYLKRKEDGEKAYLRKSAIFRTLKETGVISEVLHNGIETILTPVRNEIMFGQWKKALEILESIGALAIGQVLYDELHLEISDYILENYFTTTILQTS